MPLIEKSRFALLKRFTVTQPFTQPTKYTIFIKRSPLKYCAFEADS